MDLGKVLNLMGVLCWLSCVRGNESVPKYLIATNSGENPVANEYNVMHDFNFPDVTYPTSLLDTCQPFYFNSYSNGLDSIVGPFSSDVKSNYISLLSHDNDNKVKDDVALATSTCDLKDNEIVTYQLKNEENYYTKNESKDTNKLENIRKSIKNFLEKNDIDPELEDILSLLYSNEANERNDLNIDNNLDNYNNYEIETKSNLKDIEHSIEQIILPLLIESIVDLDPSESNIDEMEPESINNDKYIPFNINKSNDNEDVENLINQDDLYKNLQTKFLSDVIIPEPMIEDDDNTYSQINNSYTSEIKLDLEANNGNMCLLVNTNNSDSNEQEIDIIQEDIDCNSIKTFVDEQLSKPEVIHNFNYSNNHNTEHNITQPEDLDLNSYLNKQDMNESTHEDKNQLVNSTECGNDDIVAEVSNIDEYTMTIPKEAVVFDVVSKDGINLEKPLLDIVPSNLPVRLKINIEICKPDSIEKEDLSEIDDFLQTLNRIENNIDIQDLNNSIENIDENELVPQEQITVLDEINDSDFINALSLLLLDSLNNKPLEIIAPEAINAEYDRPIEYPIKCKDDDFVNNYKSIHEEQPPTVPDFIYSYNNNLNGQTNGYINPSEMKIINTSPLTDTHSHIDTNCTQKTNDLDNNITQLSRMTDGQEYKEESKTELLEVYPIIYYPYNIAGFIPNLVE